MRTAANRDLTASDVACAASRDGLTACNLKYCIGARARAVAAAMVTIIRTLTDSDVTATAGNRYLDLLAVSSSRPSVLNPWPESTWQCL